MIRIICSETDASAAANVGGPVNVMHKTFDVNLPEVEAWLTQPKREKWTYWERRFEGVEILDADRLPAVISSFINRRQQDDETRIHSDRS